MEINSNVWKSTNMQEMHKTEMEGSWGWGGAYRIHIWGKRKTDNYVSGNYVSWYAAPRLSLLCRAAVRGTFPGTSSEVMAENHLCVAPFQGCCKKKDKKIALIVSFSSSDTFVIVGCPLSSHSPLSLLSRSLRRLWDWLASGGRMKTREELLHTKALVSLSLSLF